MLYSKGRPICTSPGSIYAERSSSRKSGEVKMGPTIISKGENLSKGSKSSLILVIGTVFYVSFTTLCQDIQNLSKKHNPK